MVECVKRGLLPGFITAATSEFIFQICEWQYCPGAKFAEVSRDVLNSHCQHPSRCHSLNLCHLHFHPLYIMKVDPEKKAEPSQLKHHNTLQVNRSLLPQH